MPDYTQAEIDASMWGFWPSLAPNTIFLVAFILIFIAQVGQGIYWRKQCFLITWGIGCAFELIGYGCRVAGHSDLSDDVAYKIQISVLTLAPAFHMAGVYHQVGKLVIVYGQYYSLLRPVQYTSIFVVTDVITILVQAGGGGYASVSTSNANIGRWIMVAGLVAQVVTMTAFVAVSAFFLYQVYTDTPRNYKPEWRHIRIRAMFPYFVPALCVTILFIYVRSIFRVAELSDGWKGPLVRKEAYFLVLDGLMMVLACTSLTVVYPGVCLGRESITLSGPRNQIDKPPGAFAQERRNSFESHSSV